MDNIPVIKDVLFEVIDSTQTHATKEYENLYKGQITALRALHQTAGRGKYDRKWECQSKRNMLTTIIYPFFKNIKCIGNIPLVVGYSIISLYEQLYNLKANMKWINDIEIDNKKQGGILIESEITGDEIVLFIGIGLNVDWCIEGATNLEEQLKNKIDEEILFSRLKETVVSNIIKLDQSGFAQFQAGLNSVLYRKGELCKFVNIKTLEYVCEGVIEEINKDGILVIRESNGLSRLVEPNVTMKV